MRLQPMGKRLSQHDREIAAIRKLLRAYADMMRKSDARRKRFWLKMERAMSVLRKARYTGRRGYGSAPPQGTIR